MEITVKLTKKQKIAWAYLMDKQTQFILFGGGAGCFEGQTLIKTDKGYKKIKDIKKGQRVLSFDYKQQRLCFEFFSIFILILSIINICNILLTFLQL